jgi:hypothetical protein
MKNPRKSQWRLKKEFNFVFTPKEPSLFGGKERFAISPNRLEVYIGEENAKNLTVKALESKAQKSTFKFRKHGMVQIYIK